jgi:hypothetical protein
MHEQAYLSRYEDEYGIVQQKELPRPAVAHFLYEFLPLIDEHNKARQSALALEKKWLTKCPWTRILTTLLLGMAIVDLQRWDRRKRHHNLGAVDFAPMDKEAGDNDEILVDDFDIRRLCNLISKPLRSGAFRYRSGPQPSARILLLLFRLMQSQSFESPVQMALSTIYPRRERLWANAGSKLVSFVVATRLRVLTLSGSAVNVECLFAR